MALAGMSQYPLARKTKETTVAAPVNDNDADDMPDTKALAEKVGKQQLAKQRFQKFAKGAKPAPKGDKK